ncbi:hypothetical protein [Ruegeria lacuscaerulensis]|uniref:hypothetical protein n=1 Tax=Ruegeria lacuscaerulensis TaxID=55218 RepID=UPI00147A3388|nr:hypothetical protein [Ruegeria lacuscaerulensis]
MTNWPYRIPFDLHKELEARPVTDWESALRVWAKHHRLKLKIQWYPQLSRTISDLQSRRYTAKSQDHWMAIKEWLERHDVLAPDNLPGWPEPDTVRY